MSKCNSYDDLCDCGECELDREEAKAAGLPVEVWLTGQPEFTAAKYGSAEAANAARAKHTARSR